MYYRIFANLGFLTALLFMAILLQSLYNSANDCLRYDQESKPFEQMNQHNEYGIVNEFEPEIRKFDAGFTRKCDSFVNCTFSTSRAASLESFSTRERNEDIKFDEYLEEGTLYLSCDHGEKQCRCEEHWGLVSWTEKWNLSWNSVHKKCFVDKGGPCGYEDGLHIHCHPNQRCFKNRCRVMAELRQGRTGHPCFDDLDCAVDHFCGRPMRLDIGKECIKLN